MSRPRLLDLFCCAGGAAVGYHRAGFDVTGVDIEIKPSYPFFDLIQADAMLVLADVDYCREFDVIHASPPCQMYSSAMRHLSAEQPMLIEPVREALREIGRPYIIENVIGAPLVNPAMVCGTGLGLRVYRHRLFESNLTLVGTACDHSRPALNPHSQPGRDAIYAEYGLGDPEVHWRAAMDVAWMGRYDAREAIPPAYTDFIGCQILDQLGVGEAAA